MSLIKFNRIKSNQGEVPGALPGSRRSLRRLNLFLPIFPSSLSSSFFVPLSPLLLTLRLKSRGALPESLCLLLAQHAATSVATSAGFSTTSE
jgi:hypothetical protein